MVLILGKELPGGQDSKQDAPDGAPRVVLIHKEGEKTTTEPEKRGAQPAGAGRRGHEAFASGDTFLRRPQIDVVEQPIGLDGVVPAASLKERLDIGIRRWWA